jgi:nitrite reductase (NADH) small subunit
VKNFVRVAATSEVAPGQCKVVTADGRQFALYNVGGRFYATDNTCLHRGGPLGEGMLEGQIVTCPWHAWTYDVTTGICPANPNIAATTFPVQVEGSDILIEI